MSTSDLAARRELFRRRLAERDLESADSGRVTRRDSDRGPLSFAQRRMWLHQQIAPASHAYNVTIATTFRGPVDDGRLHAALLGVVERQEALRTTYHLLDSGEPEQRVHAELPPPVQRLDLRERPDTLGGVLDVAARTPFDLAERPLRLVVARTAVDEVVVCLVVHHIVWDGLSYACWSRDLTALYAGATPGRTEVGPADLAAHEQHRWPPPSHDEDLAFWRATLADPPAPPTLPSGRIARGPATERAERVRVTLPAGTPAALRSIARRHGTTDFVAFLVCHLLVLRRFTGAVDLTVGTTAMERETPGADELVGNFGNTLALRVDTGAATVGDLVDRVAEACAGAFSHRAFSFDRLVDTLGPPREPGRPPWFDSLLVFLSGEVRGPALPDVDVRFESVFAGATPFPLTVHAFVFPDRFDVDVHFAADLFDPVTVGAMADALGSMLLAVAADADRAVPDLLSAVPVPVPVLAEGPSGGVVAESVPEAVARRAATDPRAVAVLAEAAADGETTLTYRELVRRAEDLAGRLAALGAGPETVVGVATDRSADLVVGVLGVLTAGAAVLLLDPAHPTARLRALLADSGTLAVVAGPGRADIVPPGRPVVDPRADGGSGWTARPVHPDSAAWIGYTSGSTGVPKAIVVSHAALLARAGWARERWPVGPGEPRLAKSPVTFVDAISEIVETLVSGGTLVVADEAKIRDGVALAELLRRHGVRHLMAVPGLLAAIADAHPDALRGLDRLVSTGEALTSGSASALAALVDDGVLRNSYGCAELAGDVVDGPVPAAVSPGWAHPVGEPGPGVRALVLDPRLCPVAPGAVGDLYIGGLQVARGYQGRPGATAERFVADPLGSGGRLFRTGDRARRGRWGLEVLGRGDDQVKIRGQRVELGEVAEVARGAEGVRAAVASLRPGAVGERLVLHVVGDAEPAAVEAHLRGRVPDAMVPAAVVVVGELPLLPNGKVDRAALPEPPAVVNRDRRAAGTPAERDLCRVVGEVLGIPDVRPEDDFFLLGGDSISAIRLVAAARRTGRPLDVAGVFAARTVAALAASAPDRAQAAERPVLLDPGAHRLRRAGVGPVAAVLTLAVPGTARVGPERLRAALTEVAARHEALRLRVRAGRRGLWRAAVLGPDDPAAAPSVVTGGVADALAALAHGGVLAALVGPEGTTLVGAVTGLDATSLATVGAELTVLLDGGAPAGPGSDWPAPTVAGDDGTAWGTALGEVPTHDPAGLPADTDGESGGRCARGPVPGPIDEAHLVAAFAVAVRERSGRATAVIDRAVRGPATGVGPLTSTHPLTATAGTSVEDVAEQARAGSAHAAGRPGPSAGSPVPDVRVEVVPAGLEPAGVAPYRVVAMAGLDGTLQVVVGPGLPADLAADLLERWWEVLAQ
ncbi:non-ribosomal peptide synthetase [Pseudonocardia sp. HH130630-07]|uniref:non-ribosomal peptide synthetase n=1 Tax=Pseudonocardia sp. HH130630-07 TaxID=1690815 RepID=UPI000814CB6D|nr:non-ribosomal peptide synthetase [Pseudonocardia sp. HH130630-07]ANY07726.1 hypothetical protein AFB00_17110 [Pseudonocardia sp. HH130630-07]